MLGIRIGWLVASMVRSLIDWLSGWKASQGEEHEGQWNNKPTMMDQRLDSTGSGRR